MHDGQSHSLNFALWLWMLIIVLPSTWAGYHWLGFSHLYSIALVRRFESGSKEII